MWKKYELVNNEGCLMADIMSISFKSARSHFIKSFEGKYKIICEGESRNVRL
jgi:hypothetical protein